MVGPATLFCAPPARALEKCSAKINAKDGTIFVSATGVTGTLLWGETSGTVSNAFFDPACVAGGTAKNCTLDDVATAARITPPPLCTIYLADDTQSCSAFIEKCTPGVRTASASGVCGNALVEAGEDCEAGNPNGGACATEGVLGATLSCGTG